jgi:23S rRNA (cytidine1920-2'-O)/16S rRNA (cytidine1409-2'-O)-methyltransferase
VITRQRLDVTLVELGLVQSRSRARALILEGRVRIGGHRAESPGQPVREGQDVQVDEPEVPYVSRGGVKLAGALDAFGVDPSGLLVLDAGASTGGFTDCLLRRGARLVYAVDVGYGQIAWSLRQDPRVVVIERTNARYLTAEAVPERVDLVTADLSFISLAKVLPALCALAAPAATFIVLVKPQFELGPARVGKGGVVRDDASRKEAVDSVARFADGLGLVERGRADSVLPGPKGNREVFLWMQATAL